MTIPISPTSSIIKTSMLYRFSLLLVLVFSFVLKGIGSVDPVKLDKAKWEQLKEDVKYIEDPKEKKEDEEQKEQETEDQGSGEVVNPPNLPDLSGLGYVLTAVIIVILLIAIILLINQSNKSASVEVKRKQAATLEEAEDDLPDVELTDLFQEQIDKGEWRLALRVKFLMILQDLMDRKHIIWHKRKTNQQFAREIKNTNIRLSFTLLASTFDRVWYGNNVLSETDFNATIGELDKLHTQLHEGK